MLALIGASLVMVGILLVSIVAAVGLGPARIGMGDTLAVMKSHPMGINVNRHRLIAISACALVTGVLVAMSGPIGFVALIMPHMVRLVVGGDHRKVLPISAVAGACFLVWVDVAARMLIQPTELPIGVITAAIGAPVFLALLPYQARRAAR